MNHNKEKVTVDGLMVKKIGILFWKKVCKVNSTSNF